MKSFGIFFYIEKCYFFLVIFNIVNLNFKGEEAFLMSFVFFVSSGNVGFRILFIVFNVFF